MHKKIAIVDHVGIKSGMDCYNLGLLRGMNLQGIDSYLFSNIKTSDQDVTAFNYFESSKTSNIRSFYNYFMGHLKSYINCKRLGIDTVVIHLFSTYSKELAQYALAKIFGLKIITIVHDVNDFLDQDNDRIKNFIYGVSKKLIVHNQFSFDNLVQHIEQQHIPKISIVPHGNYTDFINTKISKEAARQQLNLDPNKRYLLFFGQIKAVKGLDLVINAMPNIDENIELIIAGRPRRFDYSQYQELIANLGIKKRVTEVIRFIENEERDVYFSAADALILPYRRIYQSGVLLLAMSHGLPIIASDLPPNKEIIQHGENGALFTSEDVKDLTSVVNQFVTDDPALQRFQSNSLKNMSEQFSWKTIAKTYTNFI